jgi:hypothetical protein
MMRLRSTRALLALILLLFAGAVPAGAAPTPWQGAQVELRPGSRVLLRAGPAAGISRVPRARPRVGPGAAAATATIQVTYFNFSPQAQAAFQHAVDIWETMISSPVPIKVEAHWDSMDSDILGGAGPVSFAAPQSPEDAPWYPIALANKLAGQDLDPSEPDIFAVFNSNNPHWYFGTDGETPQSQYDFVTTVLHELGHGLGFIGSMKILGGQGYWGILGNTLTGRPFIFDRFAVNGSGQSLIDTSLFPNPSQELRDQLTSDDVFFDGPNANAAAGGEPPRLYAPPIWNSGSSFSHLDENTYTAGDPDSLMTPELGAGESIFDPGPIALGIFRDIGWTVAGNVVLDEVTFVPLAKK